MSSYYESLYAEFVNSDNDYYVSIGDEGKKVLVDTMSLLGTHERVNTEDLIDNIYDNNDLVGSVSGWDDLKFKLGDSDSYISFEGLDFKPYVGDYNYSFPSFSLNPKKWKDQLNDVKVYIDVGMNWGGKMILEIGEETGTFNLGETTIIPSMGIDFPTGFPGVSTNGTFALNFKSDITIGDEMKSKKVEFNFNQDFVARLSMSLLGGMSAGQQKNALEGSVSVIGESDPVTGLEFSAGLIPKIGAGIGLKAPFPPTGSEFKIAQINTNYRFPTTFVYEPNDQYIQVQNIISADAVILDIPVVNPGGKRIELGEIMLSETNYPLA
ncbi:MULTISPECIES: hypothetical protein [Prochlorococcus]|uniref:hypothetical protein n=1 Tax=Prochlorococcus TaxID=1218 RepID=UPI0007B3C5F2|nr:MULTISPECIES: hypothetical protein [Prochlorococcus]KZR60723.1 hypothetical protein PMIT1312_02391 [Prochlorococcus marinus str. MIT 1312]KZR79577.1 hypothetical protein PMIT1327_01636 [Prochlorococcus marinus str. MIT 1327]NMO84687.1 hypothetical protein [Prochlorococcus sp. P1344]NMP13669.1 hypothetical protein [Prochlorococcus sp.P1363]